MFSAQVIQLKFTVQVTDVLFQKNLLFSWALDPRRVDWARHLQLINKHRILGLVL